MTAKQMIEHLSKFPPDTLLIKKSDNFELNGAAVDVTFPYETKVKLVERTFRDAFDGETFTKKVFSPVFDVNEEHVVALQFYA